MRTPLEELGRAAGWLSAPAFAAVSAVRHARVFHPIGELLEGTVEVGDAPEDMAALASALRGPVLARFSGALWKRRGTHLPDVLGCALRIRDAEKGDQDLLFATIKRPWTMGFAPLTTDVDDYLANHYYGVSPFDLAGMPRRFYLRLRPLERAPAGGTRLDRLSAAIGRGPIALAIDASYQPRGPWREVAVVRLDAFAAPDDPSLRFDPFANGHGIRPRGVIHALRRGAYAASQGVRLALDRKRIGEESRVPDTT